MILPAGWRSGVAASRSGFKFSRRIIVRSKSPTIWKPFGGRVIRRSRRSSSGNIPNTNGGDFRLLVIAPRRLLVIDLIPLPLRARARLRGRNRKRTNKSEAQRSYDLRKTYMINPNGDEFTEDDPLAASMRSSGEQISGGTQGRLRRGGRQSFDCRGRSVGTNQGKSRDSPRAHGVFSARKSGADRNRRAGAWRRDPGWRSGIRPVPPRRKWKPNLHSETWTSASLRFRSSGRFSKKMRSQYEDSADVVKGGVDRLRKVDVDRYVKPLRKKWKSWAN